MIINNPYISEYDDDIDLYSIECYERINELSRQLRSFLNYKKAVIQFRFSKLKKSDITLKNNPTKKWEGKLSSLIPQYVSKLKIIGVKEGNVAERILILLEKVRTQPKSYEINLLKEIRNLGNKIWEIIHVLSELDIYHQPHLLKVAIKIADTLCRAESTFFSIFSDFYNELKLNYIQLEEELSGLLQTNEEHQIKRERKKERVKIKE